MSDEREDQTSEVESDHEDDQYNDDLERKSESFQ